MAAAPRAVAALWFAVRCAGLNVRNTPAAAKNDMATIIAMDVRLSSNRSRRDLEIRALNTMTEGTDVFLCTDNKFEDDLDKFDNVVKRRFATVNIDMKQYGGWNTMQWFRLHQCWELIRKHEEERGSNYTFFAKLRADCTKVVGCLPTKPVAGGMAARYGHRHFDRYAFLQGDFAFGGPHAAMERIATLYDRIAPNYWGRDADYVPVDLDLVAKCDWNAAKFGWLNWPREPFGAFPCSLSEAQCFHHNLHRLKRWAENHAGVDPKAVPTFTMKTSHEHGFTSEKALVLDLLLGGFIIKEWHWTAPNQLKDARREVDHAQGHVPKHRGRKGPRQRGAAKRRRARKIRWVGHGSG